MEPAPAIPRHEAIDYDDRLVHRWRVARLTGLGVPWPLAQAAAEHVDWHQVAALVPGQVTGDGSWARVSRYALCADSGLDPDEWFPVSIEPARARHEAAAAIAVCTACLVRAQCLALSLLHWDIGQHGI